MREIDFIKMQYNPLAVSRYETMWQKYQWFYSKTIFYQPQPPAEEKDLNDIIKFVVLFFDKQSPLFTEIDLEIRKIEALKWAKVDKKSIAFKIIDEDTEYYQNICFEYFKAINNYTFEMWYSQKIQYHNLCRMARMPYEELLQTPTQSLKQLQTAIQDSMEILIKTETQLFNNERLRDIITPKAEKLYTEAYAEKYALTVDYQDFSFNRNTSLS